MAHTGSDYYQSGAAFHVQTHVMPSFPLSYQQPLKSNENCYGYYHSDIQDVEEFSESTSRSSSAMGDPYCSSGASSPGICTNGNYYCVEEHSVSGLYENPAKIVKTLRRNERERKRVERVNDGFARLRKHVPVIGKRRKLSKAQTLRMAIDYIHHLKDLLADDTATN
ncbi:uncharacterized protein TRIADDRAFT_54312 [Trichoplax adhaerens]|uniref:BHLH domain-containing protein n=1 Tax=Trichoplax adhaerens TaxID=10228 RepID=B3RRP1_TRIAD|nr:hypothetical protein TRIADDRAFT_54312 [Trichoplax adhaerens]EDV26903.1 hypothetical protein TRIADDRAFT_54312 [Trichoplax adhaerens]|eukprot:XP_002110899.1 hypothetical protein TRIADDRAFT_54312 [Trichoplax adhaerens]